MPKPFLVPIPVPKLGIDPEVTNFREKPAPKVLLNLWIKLESRRIPVAGGKLFLKAQGKASHGYSKVEKAEIWEWFFI